MIDVILRGRIGIMGLRDATRWNKCAANQQTDDRRVHKMKEIINKQPWNPLGHHPGNIITEETINE